jgi:glycosyltransferase involved in cell wall biosynthesis
MPISTDPVSVTLALGAAPYQKTLTAKLLSAGMLRQVLELVPYVEIQEPNGTGTLERVGSFPAYTLVKRVGWGIWRRLPMSVRPRPPVTSSAWLADRLLAKKIARCRIFHGCTALCLASLRAAKRNGAITLVENAACHPRHWKKVELEECRRFGVNSSDGAGNLAERLLQRMEREFEQCDRIVVPSAVAQETFAEYGYAAKTVVVQTGVDTEYFSPNPAVTMASTFRVCYVGRLELAKGVGYLLEAWKRLSLGSAELVLVGEVKAHMKSLLAKYVDCGVRVVGTLPVGEVVRCYREATLFVQPSPNEGLAQVLLEAMASGLPVVATDKTGALECVTNGKEGLVVPARDVHALAEAILWCYQHREESQEMGKAARSRIESQFKLEHYNERVVGLYRTLAGMPSGGTQRGRLVPKK